MGLQNVYFLDKEGQVMKLIGTSVAMCAGASAIYSAEPIPTAQEKQEVLAWCTKALTYSNPEMISANDVKRLTELVKLKPNNAFEEKLLKIRKDVLEFNCHTASYIKQEMPKLRDQEKLAYMCKCVADMRIRLTDKKYVLDVAERRISKNSVEDEKKKILDVINKLKEKLDVVEKEAVAALNPEAYKLEQTNKINDEINKNKLLLAKVEARLAVFVSIFGEGNDF